MSDTYRPSQASRSVIATVSVLALAFGLLAYAVPSAEGTPPPLRGTDGQARAAQSYPGPIQFERQEGATRYQTAANIATSAFDSSNDVVIATGEEFADALAGASLEGSLTAPVLLVPSDLVNGSIPSAITNAIDDLGASDATFLGGENAISTDVEDYIVDNSSVSNVDRVSGPTRFETAEEIAGMVAGSNAGTIPDGVANQYNLNSGDKAAFLATGLNWPDAMAGGPGSYAGQHPILLTTADSLHPAADRGLNDFNADVVFILGGTDVVSEDVVNELDSQGYETRRLSGANRWATAKEVADTFADDWGFGVADVGLATGFKFADALAAAPYLGNPAPLLLTPTSQTQSNTMQFFEERGCSIETMHIFGGQSAVEDQVAEDYATAACPEDGAPASLELTPQSATNPTTGLDDDGNPSSDVPAEHTVTATLTDSNGDPVDDGQQVRFEVYDRDHQDAEPFAGDVTATSGGDGTATFTYEYETDTVEGEGDPEERTIDSGGDDIIVACRVPDTTTSCVEDDMIDFDPITGDVTNIVQDVSDTAEKSWDDRQPDSLTLSPQESVNLSEETHTVTASLTDQFGDPADPADLSDPDVGFTVLDSDGNVVTADNVETIGDGADEAFNQARFTYTGPAVPDADSRANHRIIVCEDETDYTQCLDNGDVASDVLADDAAKQWVEVTGETSVQLNWQNEFREDESQWGGVDDFAADTLANDGNGTIDVQFNSDLGVVGTDGWVTVSSQIPQDGTPAGPNFHLHSGAIDAEGPVEIGLTTPSLVSSTDPDGDGRGSFTYDLTGTVQDSGAAGELASLEDAMVTDAFAGVDDGDPVDWYLNVHTTDNPAGEVRGQFQAGSPADFDVDGGLSQIPSIYESGNELETFVLNEETVTAISLNFDWPISNDGEDLEGSDFTVNVNGSDVPVLVADDSVGFMGETEITLVIDQELVDGDEVTAVFEDSGRQKVTTDGTRDGIGDGDLIRSWDDRSFVVDGDPPFTDSTPDYLSATATAAGFSE